jgi:hypothetical protein
MELLSFIHLEDRAEYITYKCDVLISPFLETPLFQANFIKKCRAPFLKLRGNPSVWVPKESQKVL